jgi:DNA-binding NarL/FixJ family response regulator
MSTNTTPLGLLTSRQREILLQISHGKTNLQVATELQMAEKTVKSHVTAIFKALGVVNRTQAARVAQESGIAPHCPTCRCQAS